MHFLRIIAVLLAGLGASISVNAAEKRELDLGNSTFLTVRDAGFVQVQYNDEGFGLTVEADLILRPVGASESSRPATKADLRRACEIVLRRAEARIGRYPPDYVFFQMVERVVDTGLIKLRRTNSTYFETRTDRCRLVDGTPQEVK